MAEKHTPGPWEAKPHSVIAPCDVHGFTSICLLISGRKTGEEVRANARLIAAAPELLEELQSALLALEAHGFTQQAGKARAAIAKATGQEVAHG